LPSPLAQVLDIGTGFDMKNKMKIKIEVEPVFMYGLKIRKLNLLKIKYINREIIKYEF
jgi:hypothetical protein